jgi:hypothetical protein
MGENLFGIGVSNLDVERFLATGRHLFPLLALGWLAVGLRLRRPAFVAGGVALANAYAWLLTSYPLQSLYGMGTSEDRLGNLGLCQVVAAGNSPLRTTQVGQLHFEPFWSLLVALASGFDTRRVLSLYAYLPLAVMVGFVAALYLALRPPRGLVGWSPGERAAVAAFTTLVASSPLDFAHLYRVPWAHMFLLKPNHALGLVLLPLFLCAFSRIRSLRGAVLAGLVLHLMGWAFVLHMVYTCVGLVVFVALSWLSRHPDARSDLRDAAVAIGVNLAVVSPYLVMLFVGYPFLVRSQLQTISATSPHLLETTLRTGVVFWVGLWGLWVAWRRGDRLGRLWTAQVLGAQLLWAGYLGLSAIGLARERDEIYFWCRFLLAGSAGLGAWDLLGRLCRRAAWLPSESARLAVLGVLALPLLLPTWWDPSRMDLYFRGSLPPVSEIQRAPAEFIRDRTPPHAVMAGDFTVARFVAAWSGRRAVLSRGMGMTSDYHTRLAVHETLLRAEDGEVARQAAARYGVTHLLITPAFLAFYPGVTLDDLDRRPHLRRLHLTEGPEGEYVAVFALRPAGVGEEG